MKSVLIVGSLNMDASVSAARLPVSGETVTGKSISYTPGGKGANQAAAAGKLADSSQVHMIGCVGKDVFGGRLIDSVSAAVFVNPLKQQRISHNSCKSIETAAY